MLGALLLGGRARPARAPVIRPTLASRIEALCAAGRPWHGVELAASARDTDPTLVRAAAAAALRARQYDRAEALLDHRPWLDTDSVGRALLGEAEAHLGMWAAAAADFQSARRLATGREALIMAVRAGAAFEALGVLDSAAEAYAAARAGGLAVIGDWLRVREARVTRDTTKAFDLLAGLARPAADAVPAARAGALLTAGDTGLAIQAFALAGRPLDVGALALAAGDSARARDAFYAIMERAPESDAAGVAVGWALARLPARSGPERVALARALKAHGAPSDGLLQVDRAVDAGDSSGLTLLLLGDLNVSVGRPRAGILAYEAAARDTTVASAALYARAATLLRIHDPAGEAALVQFVARYPTDTAAPEALYLLGETLAGEGAGADADRTLGELLARYPTDPHASRARFRLAAEAMRRGLLDSAASLYQTEVVVSGTQRLAARYWLGRVALARRDSPSARALWGALAHDDSLSYYGLRARAVAGLPALRVAAQPNGSAAPEVLAALGVLDTLILAGLDSDADAEVAALVDQPPADLETLLAWSEGLAARGWGPAAVHLAWIAYGRAPADRRALEAIFPWPHRVAVEAEAQEFGVDPLLLAALVRQESEFNPEARSTAGARGLAQLLPSTAEATARALGLAFDPAWITVPDLNLHLGAAHFAHLLRRFDGRVDAAVAAYDAGAPPVTRWLARSDSADSDQFIELIPYDETRGYARAVLRNWIIYRALYATSTD